LRIMNLNQVTLPSTNIEDSICFYRKMGFRLIVETSHYARFECLDGDSTFSTHLNEQDLTACGVVVYFETPDLDDIVEKLVQEGFSFDPQPKDEPWLWREARLRDPDGNIICLYWAGENRKNPPWRVADA
jgi:catechol 2,3-dioxygenase-like lactoylglutathione lyase family enzyme